MSLMQPMNRHPSTITANNAGTLAWAGLVAVTAACLLWLVTTQEQQTWTRSTVPLTVAGEHYRVDDSTLVWLRDFSTGHFTAARDMTRDEMASEIDRHLDVIFTAAGSRIPVFADWYFSLGGEYSRLTMAALAFANLAEPGYVAAKAAETLLPEALWEQDLATMQQRMSDTLASSQQQLRISWLNTVTERLAPYRVPPPISSNTATADAEPLALDQLLAALMEREQDALQLRIGISTLAAGGAAAGPALWRAAGARNPAAAGRAAARSAGRGAARAGSAATTGTTLCAPAGMAAVGCGVIAGATAWLVTDWLLLRLDEHRNRDELEQALHEGLDLMREALRAEMLAGYDRMLDAYFNRVDEDIRTGFVPARAGSRALR